MNSHATKASRLETALAAVFLLVAFFFLGWITLTYSIPKELEFNAQKHADFLYAQLEDSL